MTQRDKTHGGDKEHGEGNYKASREYNDATKRFVDSGRVEQAARDAEPADPRESYELTQAEIEGRRRAKEEDPALTRPARTRQDDDPQGVRVTDRAADDPATPAPGKD